MVDEKTVGIGGNLGCDPGRKPFYGGRQCLSEPKDSLETRQGDLYLLPYSVGRCCANSLTSEIPTSTNSSSCSLPLR